MSRLAIAIEFPDLSIPWRSSPAPQRQQSHRRPRARHYEAASTDRLNFSWPTAIYSSDQIIAADHRKLVARSRDVCRNSDYARSYLNLLDSNIVGSNGFRLQAQPINSLDQQIDHEAATAIEKAWKNWIRPENCDLHKKASFREQCRLFIRTVAKDGEFLGQKILGKNAGNPWEFALEAIDTARLPISFSRTERNGNTTRFGVEFDQKTHSPVAYWIVGPPSSTYPSASWESYNVNRIPAAQILHKFLAEEAGQKRGIPWTATALQRIRMVSAYETAALIAARIGASKIGHYTSELGKGYTGDDVDLDGNIIEDIEPGATRQLASGVTFQGWDPTYPTGEFEPFLKRLLHGIAAGLNVTYHALTKDLEGFSFSSARTGILEERDNYRQIQTFVIESFVDPIFRTWLERALLMSKLKIGPTPLNPLREEKYQNVRWMPKRWSWVDPQKDATAAIIRLDRGLSALSDEIIELGKDPEEVWQRIKSDQDRLEAIGIDLTPSSSSQMIALVAGAVAAATKQDPEE
jgi:lambda family phage portal protein